MKRIEILFLSTLLLSIFGVETIMACTSAVISGKATPDGRPLLWKNRDTGSAQNAIMFFFDGKYDYVGLINSADTGGKQIWIGYNSAGFAIMNTASYNLIEKDTIENRDMEGYLMRMALKYCANLQDFENMLDTMQKPMGVEANFGVIDAQGGAAYYETDNFKYTKIDANDSKIAPFGYIIRTNYSFTGTSDDGYGYIRYMSANELVHNAVASNNLTPLFIQQNMSRSLQHAHTKTNLKETAGKNNENSKFVFFEDYIPRYSSSASTVIQGIKPSENVNLTTMWTILGFPLTSVQVPIWLSANTDLPQMFTLNKNNIASLCDNALTLKSKVFPITRGSGKRYMNINALFNQEGLGIMQILRPLENRIYEQSNKTMQKWRKSGFNKKELIEFYNQVEKEIQLVFFKEFKLSVE